MLYRLSEIASICGGRLAGNDIAIVSVVTDSRAAFVAEGALFVALSGVCDGHSFIDELYARGVRAFLVSEMPSKPMPDAGFVVAGNTLSALQAWAAHHRKGFKGAVVGITGSRGKTIVKEWIAQLAPPQVKLFRSPRSYNSQLGAALSLLMLGDEDVALVEAGISHPGQMERLETMIRPDIGIITSIGDEHGENFPSLTEKLDEKLSLFKASHTILHNSTMPLIGERILSLWPHGKLIVASENYDAFRERSPVQNLALAACDRLGFNREDTLGRAKDILERRTHTTSLEIDLGAVVHNFNTLRGRLPEGVKTMAMLKASGYGNGGYRLADVLEKEGVDYFAVAFADEGVRLRQEGITKPIVVLNADEQSFATMTAVEMRLEPEIYSFRSLDLFCSVLSAHRESNYPVHIKFDTGMHRLGFSEDQAERLIRALKEREGLVRVASLFSHLAAADDPSEEPFTALQAEHFRKMSGMIIDALGYSPLLHIANSAAARPEYAFDMVRLGIGLYGFEGEGLKPVSRLRSRIVQIREVAEGESVGYGRAQRVGRPSRIAAVPVGYADGLDRRLGCGGWSCLVNGKPAPTIGRICMDICMLDVTDADAAEGDEVVIFGSQPGLRADDMARALGTIPYEIMTSVSARVKRIFLK